MRRKPAGITCVAPNSAGLVRHCCGLRLNEIEVNPSSFHLLSVRDAPIAACCDYNHNAISLDCCLVSRCMCIMRFVRQVPGRSRLG